VLLQEHAWKRLCRPLRVTAELLEGARALSISDRHHFELNLTDLLGKATQCKRNWLLNVLAAEQLYQMQQTNFDGIQTISIANSRLIKWMAAGLSLLACTLNPQPYFF